MLGDASPSNWASEWAALGGSSDALDALARARSRREQADYAAALELYREALEAAPPGDMIAHDAHLESGVVWGFMGEFDQSLDCLRATVQRWPASADAHLNLGKTLLMIGQYEEARPCLERALNLAPSCSCVSDEARKQLDLLKQFGY